MRLTGQGGVDVVYDSVGRTTFAKGLDCLAPRGMMVLYGQSSGPVEPIDPQILNQKGSLFLTRPSLGPYVATRAELLERASACSAGWQMARCKVRDRPRVSAGRGSRGPRRAGRPADHRQGAPDPLSGSLPAGRLHRMARVATWARRGLQVADGSWYLPGSGRDAATEYAAGHIPGALFFDIDASSDRTTSLPHMLPTHRRSRSAMAALGLNDSGSGRGVRWIGRESQRPESVVDVSNFRTRASVRAGWGDCQVAPGEPFP